MSHGEDNDQRLLAESIYMQLLADPDTSAMTPLLPRWGTSKSRFHLARYVELALFADDTGTIAPGTTAPHWLQSASESIWKRAKELGITVVRSREEGDAMWQEVVTEIAEKLKSNYAPIESGVNKSDSAKEHDARDRNRLEITGYAMTLIKTAESRVKLFNGLSPESLVASLAVLLEERYSTADVSRSSKNEFLVTLKEYKNNLNSRAMDMHGKAIPHDSRGTLFPFQARNLMDILCTPPEPWQVDGDELLNYICEQEAHRVCVAVCAWLEQYNQIWQLLSLPKLLRALADDAEMVASKSLADASRQSMLLTEAEDEVITALFLHVEKGMKYREIADRMYIAMSPSDLTSRCSKAKERILSAIPKKLNYHKTVSFVQLASLVAPVLDISAAAQIGKTGRPRDDSLRKT